MKTHKLIITFLGLGLLFSCSKDNNDPQLQPEIPKVTTVYVGGIQIINSLERATIWKNGIAELLPTGTTNLSRVNAIYVDEDIVYAVGYEYFPNESRGQATLWKNNEKITLQTIDSEAFSISSYKGSIYISGRSNKIATLWKITNNNIEISALAQIGPSIAKSIIKNDNGLFVAGQISIYGWTASNNFPLLFNLPSVAESFFIRGIDEFVAVNFNSGGLVTAKILKNGIVQNALVANTEIFSINGDGAAIYAAGIATTTSGITKATLWENNISKTLSQKTSIAKSVFCSNGIVYTAGSEYDIDFDAYSARLWINGAVKVLSNNLSFANAVFVTEK